MQGLVEFVKTLGASRIAAMGAVTIALIGFFVFLIMRVTTPQMTPLFTDLSLEDSAAIAKELDREAVAYQLRNDGNIIMVPVDRVARVARTMALGLFRPAAMIRTPSTPPAQRGRRPHAPASIAAEAWAAESLLCTPDPWLAPERSHRTDNRR